MPFKRDDVPGRVFAQAIILAGYTGFLEAFRSEICLKTGMQGALHFFVPLVLDIGLRPSGSVFLVVEIPRATAM